MKILAVRLGSLFDLFDRDFHPETFQLANQAFARLVYRAPVEVVAPQLLRARSVLHDVRDHHQHPMAYRHQPLLLAQPSHHAFILRGELGPLLVSSRPGGLP